MQTRVPPDPGGTRVLLDGRGLTLPALVRLADTTPVPSTAAPRPARRDRPLVRPWPGPRACERDGRRLSAGAGAGEGWAGGERSRLALSRRAAGGPAMSCADRAVAVSRTGHWDRPARCGSGRPTTRSPARVRSRLP
ncbi:hypothetical protein ADL04_11435 [Streptomyces sp. NRRL B-3648]|nr:hypothetical protein ADL04_11435 [Streptomyces sp. NRRL B-3648]